LFTKTVVAFPSAFSHPPIFFSRCGYLCGQLFSSNAEFFFPTSLPSRFAAPACHCLFLFPPLRGLWPGAHKGPVLPSLFLVPFIVGLFLQSFRDGHHVWLKKLPVPTPSSNQALEFHPPIIFILWSQVQVFSFL